MVTRVSTISELKQIFIELLINKSDKISKVSNQSILNGISYGVAKIAQKALKDIAIVESHLFPDSAYGPILNTVADNYGISERFGPSKSSTYLRLVADPGTIYLSATHIFSGNGVDFELEEDHTVGVEGYLYAKVQSTIEGEKANVPALVINSINTPPFGHKFVINEYAAMYGRDLESDELFRLRIKDAGNLAARGTLAYITQTFQKINPNVLQVRYHGINDLLQPILAVVTQNGVDLSALDLNDLQQRAQEYLNLVDLNILGALPHVEISNISYQAIDISARVSINPSADADSVREELQVTISKYLDFRFWKPGSTFEWDDVLQIVKDHPDILYVADSFFTPNQDIYTDTLKLPRVRGFLLLDLEGNLISNNGGTLNPIYYPADVDFSFHSTFLSSI